MGKLNWRRIRRGCFQTPAERYAVPENVDHVDDAVREAGGDREELTAPWHDDVPLWMTRRRALGFSSPMARQERHTTAATWDRVGKVGRDRRRRRGERRCGRQWAWWSAGVVRVAA